MPLSSQSQSRSFIIGRRFDKTVVGKIPTGMSQLPTSDVLKWKLNYDRFATGGAGKSFFGRDSELNVKKLLAHGFRFSEKARPSYLIERVIR
jgi:hypothetical protein